MSRRRSVFVSYSHADDAACQRVFTHLKNLKHLDVDVWIDRDMLRGGDSWHPSIDTALATADLAVILLSPAFLESDFIKHHELPKLRERREAGTLRMFPIVLSPCAWESIDWLAAVEHWPKGDRTLSEMGDIASSSVDRELSKIVNEIARVLGPGAGRRAGAGSRPEGGAPRGGGPGDPAEVRASVKLLGATVLRSTAKAERERHARALVERLRRATGLSDEGVFYAARFCVEYHLLEAEDPADPFLLELCSEDLPRSAEAKRLERELKRRSKLPDFAEDAVEVTTQFFGRVREREAEWRTYFDALREGDIAGCSEAAITSLCPIRVMVGFLAPQYLIAGLLSRFRDDWRPVLNAYRRAIPDPKLRSGAFESLQASQWNCWLVWGPSIPICGCAMWNGVFALQFGYGDENNSVPLIELETVAETGPKSLGPIVAGLEQERRRARPVRLTGRMRWGPWFLEQASDAPAPDEVYDLEALDRIGADAQGGKVGAAAAQAALYDGLPLAHRHQRDGLVLQLERVDLVPANPGSYFSAYLWLMFLVALPASDAGGAPPLLRGKRYPEWPETEAERIHVREARLWEDLVPVFVHANIADPAALDFQKKALVDSAVGLLRQLWRRRAELFHPDDVAAGIRFHLVSGSDYTGCGCEVRYPGPDRLLELLRAKLAAERDRDFAASVALPPEDPAAPRPDELAGYFSTCHLPELVADYYEHVRTRKSSGH